MTFRAFEPSDRLAAEGAPLATRFTVGEWREERGEDAANVEVRVAPAAIDTVSTLTPTFANVAVACARALGFTAEAPGVVSDPTLAEDEFEITVAGSARFVGSLAEPGDGTATWTETPAAGPDGRSGIAARTQAYAGVDCAAVVRGLEEVAWSTPGALAADQELEYLLAQTSIGMYAYVSVLSNWGPVLRQLASARVPLARPGDPTLLNAALEAVQATPTDVTPCERLAYRLRPYEIRVWLGSNLHETIEPDRSSRFRDVLVPAVRQRLFEDLGAAFPHFTVERSDELAPDAYRIVVNALTRANGRVPSGKIAIAKAADDVPFARGELWFDETGRPGSWIDPEDPARVAAHGVFDAADVITTQLYACLREAASEFVDMPWTQQQLNRLGNDMPDLVAATHAHYEPEELTRIFSALVEEGVSIRNLPPILEHLVERAVKGDRDGDTVEDLRLARASWLCQRDAQELAWDSDSPLRKVRRLLSTLRLDSDLEAALRADLHGGSPPNGQYARRALLRGLRLALPAARSALAGEVELPPALVTAPDLRAATRRAIAAQFPLIPVLAVDEIEGEAEEETIGRIRFAPTPGPDATTPQA